MRFQVEKGYFFNMILSKCLFEMYTVFTIFYMIFPVYYKGD